RQASPAKGSEKVVEQLNRGIPPQSIWDSLFSAAGELLMRRPGILSLHASTSTNALHFAFQNSGNDETRRLLLLQNAAFLSMFRSNGDKLKAIRIDQLQAGDSQERKAPSLEDIFAQVSHDRLTASRQVLGYLQQNPEPQNFINAARRLIFLKG